MNNEEQRKSLKETGETSKIEPSSPLGYEDAGPEDLLVGEIPEDERPRVNMDILNRISDAVRCIGYGEVVLTIQDGKIVQMEKTERLRFR